MMVLNVFDVVLCRYDLYDREGFGGPLIEQMDTEEKTNEVAGEIKYNKG